MQTVNAETKARKAIAESRANAVEQEEARKAEVTVRNIENQYEELVAETKVNIMQEKQLEKVGIEKVLQDMKAQEGALLSEIEAEKQKLEMLRHKFEAEIVTPAKAEKERMVLQARQQTFAFLGKAEGEIEELKETIDIINQNPETGNKVYLIENFERLIRPFAETLDYFPAKNISVITGLEGRHEPISAIHPSAVEEMKNNLISYTTAGAVKGQTRPDKDLEE